MDTNIKTNTSNMDDVQGHFLQNENQRDAPLSDIADNYVVPHC